MMGLALTGARVFDGVAFHDDVAVLVDGRHITAIEPSSSLPTSIKRIELDGGVLAPGFIDVQVNGGGGALLNHQPSLEVVDHIAQSHRRFGTVGLLPTVITDAPDITRDAIAAVGAARDIGMAGILGIHVEGPFLDPARRGAHDAAFIRAITDADIKQFVAADCGAFMLTLAPNCVSPQNIRRLVDGGILVSLGHSDANYNEVKAALAVGATSFTHLFNAMSPLTAREPGMVGAALADAASFIGVIADGLHVHEVSLQLAFSATSIDRFMLVSDAMPSAAGGPDHFMLQGREVRRVGNRLTLPDGTLAGSSLTMDAALRYCVTELNMDMATALRMASANPARFLGMQNQLGLVAPGALASLVHLDDNMNVTQTWVEGR